MTATFTKGHTYTSNSQVTGANLGDLLDQAGVFGIDRSNVDDTSYSILTRSESPPTSPYAKEVWLAEGSNFPCAYVGGNWLPMLNTGKPFRLAASSAAILKGSVLAPFDYDPAETVPIEVTIAPSSHPWRVVGISVGPVSPGGQGVMVHVGVALIRVSGSVVRSNGLVVVSDGIAGDAGNNAYGSNVFAHALANDSGGFCWATLLR